MAYTKKKTTDLNVSNEENISKSENIEVNKENENLKAEMAELKAQLNFMAQMLSNSKKEKTEINNNNDRYITFINMTKGGFTIRGTSLYHLNEQFEKRRFLEHEAKIILNNMGNSVRQGLLYIADAEFVKENHLSDTYSSILSEEQLKNLLSHNASEVIEIFKNVSDGQRNIIINMIENKKLHGENIDANILVKLGELVNKDLINMQSLDKTREE